MTISKNRLETFTDGVIAIIITIMVLSIPLPKSFVWSDLLKFGTSLIIYLLSFLVVGAFWNQHHQTFSYLDNANQKIIVVNIFFLFFLSLIPLFTEWVIENQGELIPVVGYDIIYFIVSLLHILTYRFVIKQSNHKEIKQFYEKIKTRQINRAAHPSWKPHLFLFAAIAIVVFISIYFPKVATFILMGIPIAFSIVNLFNSNFEKRKR